MRHASWAGILLAALCLYGCMPRQHSSDHVIILGFDAMSALGIQRAETPHFNRMIENGAVSLHTRCVRETVSSQNWMSMVSGAPIEMHGVFNNSWKPGAPDNVPPALTNAEGKFPTVFDLIREQRPELKQYAFIEWTDEARMYDVGVFDKCCVYRRDTSLKEPDDVIRKAFESYLEDRPEVLFLSMDQTDHVGHVYGHESQQYFDCISHYDALVGEFVDELERRGWMKDAVIIITADHGGIRYGHGGDSMAEFEIPVILYGKGVTKGKLMKRTNMIYDVAATVAGLLGIEMPWECRGKFLSEAFEPADTSRYVPVPVVHPFEGLATGPVSITADAPDARIYYTLDGTQPDESALPYTGPFTIQGNCEIRSVAYVGSQRGGEAVNFLYADRGNTPVFYKLYRNYTVNAMPNFTKLGKASASGYIKSFSIEETGAQKEDYFAIHFYAQLIIDEEDDYTFELRADDGANLWLDDRLLINNENAHNAEAARYGTAHLKRGLHPVKLEYYEHTKTNRLSLRFRRGEGPLRPVTPPDLSR